MSSMTDGSRSAHGRGSPRCLPLPRHSSERGIVGRNGDGKDGGDDRLAITMAASRYPRPLSTSAAFSPAQSPGHRSTSSMFPPPLPKVVDGYEKTGSRNTPEMSTSPRPSRKRPALSYPPLDVESLRSDMSDSDSDEHGSSADRETRDSILALETFDPPGMAHGDFICLCTPAPKIPRPRNAFILFRQHYQAHVVSENPGLTNPEISKIIGRMWQKQPKDVKDDWKSLADKEKARHRMQYPDYRYQPRRVSKGASASGGRPGPTGSCGSDGANGEPDPSRCPKCGGRYLATPRTPSTPRYALGPTKPKSTPTSAFGMFSTIDGKSSGPGSGGHTMSASFEAERNYRHGLASPGLSQYSSVFARSYQRDTGRRPLPQHGRLSSASGSAAAGYNDDMMPPDQKRRRYDMPMASPAHPASSNAFVSYRSPHQHYSSTPPPMTPTSAPLPSYHRPPHVWMDPPPPPSSRLAVRGDRSAPEAAQTGGRLPHQYPASSSSMTPFSSAPVHHSISQTQRTPAESKFAPSPSRRPGEMAPARDYAPQLARLPPPGTSYGYYQLAGGADNVLLPPSTAMGGMSMAAATPRSAPTAAESLLDSSGGADRRQQTPSGIADDSLKLPPLQTYMLPKAQSPGRSDPGSGGGSSGNNSAAPRSHVAAPSRSSSDKKMAVDSGCDSAGSGYLQDIRSFAISPMPRPNSRHVDRNSQASGVRAMVMSVPYLNKLEVLRRISPPTGAQSKRGPVIAVEGHDAALIAEVGCIIEKALMQSGECAVGVWSTLADRGPDKPSSRGGDCDAGNDDDPADGPEALSSYHKFILSWHKKSQEIVRHVKARGKPASVPTPSSSSSATPQPEEKKKGTGAAAAALTDRVMTPPAPPSPASSASQSASPSSPDRSPHPPAAKPSSPAAARLPVALITGGYSLSISDHYATSVPIEDGFPPIGHWEWMATLWRGTVCPDLVVYADPQPASKPTDSSVNPYAQEGVMVFHVPPRTEGGSQDGAGKKLVDDKSSRRLAFEVMEWVRNAGFCDE